MRKTWILALFVLMTNVLFACDLCTVYLGIQPNDFQNSIQLRHRYRLFQSDYINQGAFSTRVNNQRIIKGSIIDKHAGSATDEVGMGEQYTYAEEYNSYELMANFYLSPVWQLSGTINFSDNFILQNDSIIDNVGGIGDLKVLLRYTLVNSVEREDSASNRFIHRVNLGAGVSLPTGSYNKYSIVGFVTEFKANTILGSAEMELDPHIQAGTGSFGYLGLLEYQMRYKAVGFNSNISYQINATNSNDFRLSNRLNINNSLFFVAKLNDKVQLMPNMGIAYEQSDYDIIEGTRYIDSGGEAVFFNQGLSLFVANFNVGLTYFQPIIQKLHGTQPLNNRRIITQLTYNF